MSEDDKPISQREGLNYKNRNDFTEILMEMFELIEELEANSQQYKVAGDMLKRLNELFKARQVIIHTITYRYLERTHRTPPRVIDRTKLQLDRIPCSRCGRQVKIKRMEEHQERSLCKAIWDERQLVAVKGNTNYVFVSYVNDKATRIIQKKWREYKNR